MEYEAENELDLIPSKQDYTKEKNLRKSMTY